MRWILGLVLVLGVAASPLMTAFAQDASPVVDQPVSTEPDTPDPVATVQDPANAAAPTDVATDVSAGASTATDPVFSAASAPVMTIDGGTDSPVSVPAGGQVTVAVSGLGQVQIFFYTAPGGCPQDDSGRSMYNGPVIGDTSFTRTGSPGTTEYLQAQLYGGAWSNCIQVNWLAAPTATATAPMPAGPGAMSFTVNGQTSGTLSVNPDDLVTVHAVNVSTLILYSEGGCAGVPYSASGVMLDSVLSHPANAWIAPPTANFSMQAHGMDSSTGACITVAIIQPTDTAVPTATATSTAVPTDTPTDIPTASATAPNMTTDTAIPTPTATATATQQVPVLTVNGSTLSPVHVPGGSVATLLTSGLTPGGTVAYGASQAGCPSSVASPGMQGPFAIGVDGTSTFQAGGISGATWNYQASQNGVWSNCLQLIWGATFTTPTPTQTSPALFVNDDDAAVVHVNYPSASIWVRWSGIPRLNVYPSADCSGIPVTSYTVSGFGSVYKLSPEWATLVGGYVFSLQGFAPPKPGAITSCRTVILDNAPTVTATATATASATSTSTTTATMEPTSSPTAIVTTTAQPTDTATSSTIPTDTPTEVPTGTATAQPTDTATSSAVPTITQTPTDTPIPLTNPPLTIDGMAQSKTVAITTEVHLLTDANARISYWYAADCSGAATGVLTGFSSWVSWNTPMVVSFQAARTLDPTRVSACLTVTWADIGTDTPVPTATATSPATTVPATATPTATMPADTATPTSTATSMATSSPTSTPARPTATATTTATETPTEPATETATATATVTSTESPTSTATGTATEVVETATPSPATTETPTATEVPTSSATSTASATPTATSTATTTETGTSTPSATVTASVTATAEPRLTATVTASPSPTSTSTSTASTATIEPTGPVTATPSSFTPTALADGNPETPRPGATATVGVSTLPNTGAGPRADDAWVWQGLAVAGAIAMAAAFVVGGRRRRVRRR